MHITRSKDTKRIEKKMVATFYTQRNDIIKGMETPVLLRDWPYLFEMCGMMAHFKELTAGHFMVAVDQTIVNGSVPNVVDALTLMFAAYYCLNISYPTELGGTLEFLQRCLFKINPDKGTTVERKASKKQQSVNPKVLSLITNIADFEWRE
ncbi:hypothetical protein KUCAC02_026393 [Chaenocephalus aceratus]|uniref:Uncharacterized protein n=1 Tax=Chaenocephalus aceratus TaxID=36190 RepID=A0ACB9VY41_CHAAC|nr:hypothetical protein KUCAC02_026393 [Chaenocephalus aceratus]